MSHLFLQMSWVLEKAQISELVDGGNLLQRQQAAKDFLSLSMVLLVSEAGKEPQGCQMDNSRQWPNTLNSLKEHEIARPILEEIFADLRLLSRKLTFVEVRTFPHSIPLINVEIRRESQRNSWKVGFLIHLCVWPLWTLNPCQESVRPVIPQDGVRPLLSIVTEVMDSEWSCPLRPRMGIQSYARTRDKGNTTSPREHWVTFLHIRSPIVVSLRLHVLCQHSSSAFSEGAGFCGNHTVQIAISKGPSVSSLPSPLGDTVTHVTLPWFYSRRREKRYLFGSISVEMLGQSACRCCQWGIFTPFIFVSCRL